MAHPLIVLTGPTAAGKTELSVNLARAVDGEIISADSMQVYRHMDIGSAKITRQEMDGVPHHLIDVLEPTEEFNVVIFQKIARKAIKEIYGRGRIPIVAGAPDFIFRRWPMTLILRKIRTILLCAESWSRQPKKKEQNTFTRC